jgi:hypothetical protein
VDTLLMLAGMSVGCTAGIGIGCVIGYARGRSHGVTDGQAMERQSRDSWDEFCAQSGYAKVIPHGRPGHICTNDCYRKR